MLGFFWTLLWTALVALGGAAGVRALLERRRRIRAGHPVVDDAAIARILETGALTVEDDEPLDLDEIEAEERRFWAETWDEPDDEWSPR